MARPFLLACLAAGAVLAICPTARAQAASDAHAAEIDQALVALPTTLPLNAHKSYFRLTHRFARDLGQGSFGDLVGDLFSLDNGAVMGLEYRFGLTATLQAGLHRSTLGKTINTFGRWDAVRQGDGSVVGISPMVTIEGQNNLRLDPQPGLSVTVSHVHGSRLSLYATPTYVHNAHTETLRLLHEGHAHAGIEPDAADLTAAADTFFLGLGARARVLDTVAVVFEASPRLAGYAPGVASWNAAVEKLTRGHVLQLNFGNNFNTTPGMLARGGVANEVFLGFNLSRKF